MQHISLKIVQRILVLLLILVMGGLIFIEMLPYLSGVLGAITLYVLMKKWMATLVRKGWRPSLAASFLMLLSFIGVLLPVAGLIFLLTNRISQAVDKSVRVVDAIKKNLIIWQDRLGFDFSSQIDLSAISSWLTGQLQSFADSTFHIVIAIGIMYFMLYYMLTSSKSLSESITAVVPFSKENVVVIRREVQAMVRSNALGIPLVALAQGIIAIIGFLIFGIADPLFWFVIVVI